MATYRSMVAMVAIAVVALAVTSAPAVNAQTQDLCAGFGPPASGGGGSCNIQCLVADPVCGANGVTYGCGCVEAACNGVPVVKRGPC